MKNHLEIARHLCTAIDGEVAFGPVFGTNINWHSACPAAFCQLMFVPKPGQPTTPPAMAVQRWRAISR